MEPPQGAQPRIVCAVSGANIKEHKLPRLTCLGHAVEERREGLRRAPAEGCGLAHVHWCADISWIAFLVLPSQTRMGGPWGTLTRLPLAFLSGFVRLFVAEHVRRCWFLSVLIYLPAYFVVLEPDRVQRLAAARAC